MGSTAAVTTDRRFCLALAAVVAPLYAVKLWSYDFWWHLATGRQVWTERAVPTHDGFTWTAAGEPWTYVNWLGDLVLFGAWSVGGAGGVVALKVLCAGACFYGMAALARGAEVGRGATAAAVVVAAVLVQPRYSLARNFVLGVVLMVVLMHLAARWLEREDRSLWLAVPLCAVWMATHGTVLLGIALVGVSAVAATLERVEGRRSGWGAVEGWLVAGACASLLVVMPQGRELMALMGQGLETSMTRLTWEQLPPDPSSPHSWVPYACLALGVLGGAVGRERSWLPLGWAALGVLIAWQRGRGMYPAVLLAVPGMALALQVAFGSMLERSGPGLVAVGLVVVHLSISERPALRLNWGFGVDETEFTADAVEALAKLPPGRVLNNLEIGGYLSWHGVAPAIDGRTHVLFHGDDYERLVMAPARNAESLEVSARTLDVTYGLCTHTAPLCHLMMAQRAWVPLHHGRTMTLFARRERVPPGAGMDELRALPQLDWMRTWYREVLADPEARERLRGHILRVRREVPDARALKLVEALLAADDPAFSRSLGAPPR